VVKKDPPSQDELEKMAAQTLPQMLKALPALKEADVVFLGLHGGYGEDGSVQAFLDMAGIRYTGSGHLASALAMDKDLSKHLFRRAGVQTANWVMARRNEPAEEQKDYRTESREGDRSKIKRSGGDGSPAEACAEVAPDEGSHDSKYDRDYAA
jgi:D-alanine-D-alanine ligase